VATLPHRNALAVPEANPRNGEAELERLREQKRPAQEIQAQDDLVQTLKGKFTEARAPDDQRKKAEDLLLHYREQLARLDARIGALLTPEILNQNFKFWMSGTFAILVLIVIIGFFVLAWHDDAVRRAIFAGAAGIQFVTLFSLVIAIILFGNHGDPRGQGAGGPPGRAVRLQPRAGHEHARSAARRIRIERVRLRRFPGKSALPRGATAARRRA
jgi:hypothetical protein